MATPRTRRYTYTGTRPVYVAVLDQWIQPGATVTFPTHLTPGLAPTLWRPASTRKTRKG